MLPVDGIGLTRAGAVMLVAGALLPVLPGNTGIPCLLRSLTGVPCPMCGMTTSVSATLRLQVVDALAANPAGVLAVVVAIVLVIRRPTRLAVPLLLVVAGLGAMWMFQLHRLGW